MTTRLLPRDEWDRLEGTETDSVRVLDDAKVLVVEQDGAIVGSWALYPVYHAEGIWIAPDHQGKAAVARTLLTAMRALAQAHGLKVVWTATRSPEVGAMLTRLQGVTIPGTHYAVPVGGTYGH